MVLLKKSFTRRDAAYIFLLQNWRLVIAFVNKKKSLCFSSILFIIFLSVYVLWSSECKTNPNKRPGGGEKLEIRLKTREREKLEIR